MKGARTARVSTRHCVDNVAIVVNRESVRACCMARCCVRRSYHGERSILKNTCVQSAFEEIEDERRRTNGILGGELLGKMKK